MSGSFRNSWRSRRSRSLLVLSAVLVCTEASGSDGTAFPPDGKAFAQDSRSREPAPVLNWRREAGWITAGLAMQGYGQWSLSTLPRHDPASASPNELWRMDRSFAGTYSRGYARFSDAAAALALAPALLGDAVLWGAGRSEAGWMVADFLWLGEASLLVSGINLWVRSRRVHPRPLTFAEGAPTSERTAPEAGGSFFSGHATQGFLGAAYFTESMRLRHPREPWVMPVSALAYACAGAAAWGRVRAGKHYPSDVLAGAALGMAAGWGMAHYRLRGLGSSAEARDARWALRADAEGLGLSRTWSLR